MNARFLASNLLLNIDHRGGDATGAAWRTPKGTVATQKAAVRAPQLVSQLQLSQHARTAILHTRLTTLGSEKRNVNNHPVFNSGLVGVHNGMLWYDGNDIFDMLPNVARHGEVDSEAIFAAIANYEELGVKSHLEALELIEGSAAVAWMSTEVDDPWLHAARISGSPFCWAQTEVGSFIFASEMVAIEDACDMAGLRIEHKDSLLEGSYLAVKNGVVHVCDYFEVPTTTYYRTPARTSPSKSQAVTGWGSFTVPRRSLTGTFEDEPRVGPATDPITLSLSDFDANLVLASATGLSDRRKDAIEEWERVYHPDGSDECLTAAQWWDAMVRYHGFAKVGDVVWTSLRGDYAQGQIARVPHTFPHGEFVIRLVVDATREGGKEVVYVARQHDEFLIEGAERDALEQSFEDPDPDNESHDLLDEMEMPFAH